MSIRASYLYQKHAQHGHDLAITCVWQNSNVSTTFILLFSQSRHMHSWVKFYWLLKTIPNSKSSPKNVRFLASLKDNRIAYLVLYSNFIHKIIKIKATSFRINYGPSRKLFCISQITLSSKAANLYLAETNCKELILGISLGIMHAKHYHLKKQLHAWRKISCKKSFPGV